MKSELRNRIILPVLLPIVVLVGVALAVGAFALIFLYNTRVLALTIAIVAAAGIMVAIALAAAIDEEDMTVGRRGVIVMTGLLPVVVGAGISLWAANGGVDPGELNINAEEVVVAPEGAVVGAQNDQSFCVFAEGETEGECTDTDEVSLPAQPEAPAFRYLFVNLQAAIPHNFQIFELAGSADAPEPGELLFGVEQGANTIEGPDEVLYAAEPNEYAAGDTYYYNCVVHPAMNGVLTITGEGGAGAESGGGEAG